MKILMLTPECFPLISGVGTYIVELIKNLPEDIDIHVITPKRHSDNYLANEKNNDKLLDKCKIHYTGEVKQDFYKNLKFQLDCKKLVPSIIKQNNIDLIHSQSTMPDLFLNPTSIHIPTITTIHTTVRDEIIFTKTSDTSFSNMSKTEKTMLLLSPILKIIEKRYYSQKRHYITVSDWMKNRVIRDFKILPSEIGVIYNGVDVNTYNPSQKKYFKEYFPELSDITSPKVLFLSRWVERKGIRYLLKSIPNIIEKHDVHFIFGGPVDKDKLKIPTKNCTFLGYIPQEKIPCLFASCDIFLLPSLYENFPFVLLEAMSSNTAVISTDVGGIPELITHQKNGLMIRSQNSEDIIKSVLYLAENEQIRKTLGDEARRTVEKQFTWQKIALDMCDYYKKIVKKEE